MSDYNYSCDKCPRTFKLEEFYEKHKKVHELKKQHRCEVCGFVYGAAKGLEGHLKTHTEKEVAAANAAKKQPAAEQKANGNEAEPPYNINFHFLNRNGVLAQAQSNVPSPPPQNAEQSSIRRGSIDGEKMGGSGNYEIYGKQIRIF